MKVLKGQPFFICPKEILNLEVSRTSKFIYMVLCSVRDDNIANPSYKRLSQICQLHKNTIRQSVRELETLGVLKRKFCYAPNGKQLSNQYLIRGFGDVLSNEKTKSNGLTVSIFKHLLRRK